MPYPWLTDALTRFVEQEAQGRLPHGLLLLGAPGLGKEAAALEFCQWLHCQQRASISPCGQCSACQLFIAGSHPDHLFVAPEEEGKAILIDQIRALVEFSHRTATQGGYRTIVVSPAQQMNWNAQNALLKTLEEPGAKTLLLLVGERPSQFLPTVVSRCQQHNVLPPSIEDGVQWLASQHIPEEEAKGLLLAARGAPLQAMALKEKPWFEQRETLFTQIATIQQQAPQLPQIAKQLAEFHVEEFLTALYQWLALAIKSQHSAITVQDKALLAGIKAFSALRPERLFAFQDAVLRALTLWVSGANPNKEMLYEQLLMVLLGVPVARDVAQAY